MIRNIHEDNFGSRFDFKTRLRMRLIKETQPVQCKNEKLISSKDGATSLGDITKLSAKQEQSSIGESSKNAGTIDSEPRAESSKKTPKDPVEARESKIPTNAADEDSIGKIKLSKKFEAPSSVENVKQVADRSSGGNILPVEKAIKKSPEQDGSKTKDLDNGFNREHSIPWRSMFGEHFKNEALYIKEMYSKSKVSKDVTVKPFTVGGTVPHKTETKTNTVAVDNRNKAVGPKVKAKVRSPGQSKGRASQTEPTLSLKHSESQRIIQKLFPSKAKEKTDNTKNITIVDAEGNSLAVKGSHRVLSRAKTEVSSSKFKRSTYKAFKIRAKRTIPKSSANKKQFGFPLKEMEQHSAEKNQQSGAVKQNEVKIHASKGPVHQSSQPATSHLTAKHKTNEITTSESRVSKALEARKTDNISKQPEAVKVAIRPSPSEADKRDESTVGGASTDNQTKAAKAQVEPKPINTDVAAKDEPKVQSMPPRKSLCTANVEKWMARAKKHKHQEEKRQKMQTEDFEADDSQYKSRVFRKLFPNLPLENKFFKGKVWQRPFEVKRQSKKDTESPKPKGSMGSKAEPAKEPAKDGLDSETFGVSPALTRTYDFKSKDTSSFPKSPSVSYKTCQTPATKESESLRQFDSNNSAKDEPNKNTIQALLEQRSPKFEWKQQVKKETKETIGDIIAQIRQKTNKDNADATGSTGSKTPKNIHDDRGSGGAPAASLTDRPKDDHGKLIGTNADATGISYGNAEFLPHTIEKVSKEPVCKADLDRGTVDEPYVSISQSAQLTNGASNLRELSQQLLSDNNKLLDNKTLAEREKAIKELDLNISKAKVFRKEAERERARKFGSILKSTEDKIQLEPLKTDEKTAIKQKQSFTQSFSKIYNMILGKRSSGNNEGGSRNITTYAASLDKSKEGPSQVDPYGEQQKVCRPKPEEKLDEEVFISPDLEKFGLGKEAIREERKRNEKVKETTSQKVSDNPEIAKSGTGSFCFGGADASADNVMGNNKTKANPIDDETCIRGGSLRESRTKSPITIGQHNDIIIKGGSRKMLQKLRAEKATNRVRNPGKLRFFAMKRLFAPSLIKHIFHASRPRCHIVTEKRQQQPM